MGEQLSAADWLQFWSVWVLSQGHCFHPPWSWMIAELNRLEEALIGEAP